MLVHLMTYCLFNSSLKINLMTTPKMNTTFVFDYSSTIRLQGRRRKHTIKIQSQSSDFLMQWSLTPWRTIWCWGSVTHLSNVEYRWISVRDGTGIIIEFFSRWYSFIDTIDSNRCNRIYSSMSLSIKKTLPHRTYAHIHRYCSWPEFPSFTNDFR